MRRSERSGALGASLLLVAGLGPLAWLVAALGARTGLIPRDFAFDVLAGWMTWAAATLGLLAALALSGLSVRNARLRPWAAAAVVIPVVTFAALAWRASQPDGPGEDVTTSLSDPPGFGPLAGLRDAGPKRMTGATGCPGAVAVPTQSAPEAVVYVLQEQGWTVRRAGVTGVYATRRSFWFGFAYDAGIRIRPGRTDVRVAARDAREHGGAACALATDLVEGLGEGL